MGDFEFITFAITTTPSDALCMFYIYPNNPESGGDDAEEVRRPGLVHGVAHRGARPPQAGAGGHQEGVQQGRRCARRGASPACVRARGLAWLDTYVHTHPPTDPIPQPQFHPQSNHRRRRAGASGAGWARRWQGRKAAPAASPSCSSSSSASSPSSSARYVNRPARSSVQFMHACTRTLSMPQPYTPQYDQKTVPGGAQGPCGRPLLVSGRWAGLTRCGGVVTGRGGGSYFEVRCDSIQSKACDGGCWCRGGNRQDGTACRRVRCVHGARGEHATKGDEEEQTCVPRSFLFSYSFVIVWMEDGPPPPKKKCSIVM